MPDIVDQVTRSRMMAGIRGKDTKPEMILRRGLHARGLRFRLHARDLPGRPDLVFSRRRAVLFAHGCFWHGHDCHLFRLPGTRREYWGEKIARNRRIDEEALVRLQGSGWRTAVVWECALRGRDRLPLEAVIGSCEAWILGDESSLEIRGSAR